jgi:hypothetical protein
MEGGQVPSELRIYARQTRELYGNQVIPKVTTSATQFAG